MECGFVKQPMAPKATKHRLARPLKTRALINLLRLNEIKKQGSKPSASNRLIIIKNLKSRIYYLSPLYFTKICAKILNDKICVLICAQKERNLLWKNSI